jgi:hypothetical protein
MFVSTVNYYNSVHDITISILVSTTPYIAVLSKMPEYNMSEAYNICLLQTALSQFW